MDGNSKFKARFTKTALAVALASVVPPVVAQQELELEEILVTGSRIRTGRQNTSIPVSTLSSEQIKLSGSLNVEDVLNTMPQFVPSRTSSTNSTANPTATGAATLNLRGLGDARNLVLVNGRRYTIFDSSQTTDINTIPVALVQRIDVVTGGASAVYGSDAIAGVTNFILRDDYEGTEFRAQYNLTGEGDGDIADLSVTFGSNFADDRGNAVVSFNYFDRDSILTTDRDFSSQVMTDGTVNGVRTLVTGGSSFVPNGRFTGIPFATDAISAIDGLDVALAAAGLSGIDGNGFIPGGDGQSVRPFTRPGDLFNYTLDNFLRIPQERISATSLGHFDFNDTVTGYYEAAYTENTTTTGFASSFINQSFPVEVNNPYISSALSNVLQTIDASSDNNGLVNLGINRRLVELGPRRNEDVREAYRVLLGLRGEINNFDYDVYYSYADSENTQRQFGNASRAAFASGILSNAGAAPVLNPFGANISADGIAFLGIETTNVEKTELEVVGATITGELFDLPAGPFAALFGFEWRSSSVDFNPDAALESGDVAGFNRITAASGDIGVREVFAEVDIPILADVAGAESLAAKAAYRYSDYDLDRVGGVNTFLGGLDWRINSKVSFGAQFQRAIRAPNVGEAFGGQRSFPVSATDPCALPSAADDATVRDLCIANGVPASLIGNTAALQPNTEIPGLFGGNPDLSEEKSDTVTFGVVFTPNEDLRISLDYFDIEVEDAIASFGGSVSNVLNLCFNQIQSIDSVACQAIGRNASGVIDTTNPVTVLNENSGLLETSGVDLSINYGFDLANAGRIKVNFTMTRLDEFNLVPIGDLPAQFNDCLGAFGRTCGEPKAEFKTNTTITWVNDNLTVNLRHRWSESTELDDIVLPQRRGVAGPSPDSVAVFELDGQNYFDLSANYQINDSMAVWGGIINVFDEDPPLLGSRQARANTRPDTFSPTGIEFFLGLSVKFE